MRRRDSQVRKIVSDSYLGDDSAGCSGTLQPSAHKGWKVRNTTGESSVSDTRGLPSSEVAETPCDDLNRGNDEAEFPENRNSSLESGVVTLRCMYTNQKTKKRKVWSDGAIKCCRKRLRVCLYRWSEVLGVTDKLLGEIYLSVPEYDAFVTMGEPELEMEMYLVSLDGVIQESCNENTVPDPDSNKSGGFVGGNGRKRKLLKPFKPPTRRAPPISTAVPPGDAWGSAGEMSQQRYARDRDNDDEVLPVRASFTGFGHVESLWENDDTNAEETALGSTPDGDCWVNKDGDDRCINDQAFDGENIEAEERAIGAQGIRTSGVRLGSSMSDYLWRQEDHPAAVTSLPAAVTSLPPTEESRADSQLTASKNYARSDAIEHRIDKRDGMGNAAENYSGGVVRREHLRDPRGRATWAISRETSGMTTEREAHGSARIDPHGYSLELSGDSPIRKDNRGRHWDPEGVSENVGGAHEPESGPGEENGDGEVRSTEDILSLFGGFGASNQPHPGETVGASKLLGSRQSTAKLAAEGHAINGRLHELRREGNTPQREGNTPPSGGGDLATGMRRAQQASQSTGWKDAGAAEVADASKAALDWSCEVCGVRASSASTSCRVCGTLAPGSGIEHKDDLGDGSVADEQDA